MVVASAGSHPWGGSSFGGTVTVSVNGNQVNSPERGDSPGTISFNYKTNIWRTGYYYGNSDGQRSL